MTPKIAAGAAALVLITVVATGPASAQRWQWNRGDVPAGAAAADVTGYAPGYYPGYYYAPLYGYYGTYDWGPWSYRGGPHPR
jgi:hypothetical protein